MRMDAHKIVKFLKSLAAHYIDTLRYANRRLMLVVAVSIFLVLGPTMALAVQDSGNANNVSNSETRANPAPWRPAFGSINKNANDPASASNQPPVNTPEAIVSNNLADNNSAGNNSNNSANNPASNSSTNANANANSVSNSNATSLQPTPIGANLPQPDSTSGGATVTQRMDKLPNSAGQVWREYDISPYTSKITNNENPQTAIIDWITRETGTEMWFNQPLGILSANPNQLYVYHTPEIQAVVKRIVDRFVRTRGQLQTMDVTLMTIESPSWRSSAYTMLQPIEVRSPGVEAWMISKENAAILQSQLTRRADARLSSSGTLTNHDGQAFELKKRKPVQFVSSLQWVPNSQPNYQPLLMKIDEGYTLSLSCLSALDNSTIEAMIKCDVDQVEKLNTVKVNVPGIDGSSQQMNLQIPQLVSWRLHERFRWPNDQVLLLSCGVVANLDPQSTPATLPLVGNLGSLGGLAGSPKRGDALLFIEYRGPATGASMPRAAGNLVPIRR